MSLPIQLEKDFYSYAEYLTWPDDVRYELINGVPYLMSPAPSVEHQRYLGRLFGEIQAFLKGKPCESFVAPFDVRLSKEKKRQDKQLFTVVQPDITIVCDRTKLADGKGCLGTPDWIIEIISPANAQHDYIRKLNLYEAHGVPEYWIVHPIERVTWIYRMGTDGRYARADILGEDGKASPALWAGELTIDFNEIFTR